MVLPDENSIWTRQRLLQLTEEARAHVEKTDVHIEEVDALRARLPTMETTLRQVRRGERLIRQTKIFNRVILGIVFLILDSK